MIDHVLATVASAQLAAVAAVTPRTGALASVLVQQQSVGIGQIAVGSDTLVKFLKSFLELLLIRRAKRVDRLVVANNGVPIGRVTGLGPAGLRVPPVAAVTVRLVAPFQESLFERFMRLLLVVSAVQKRVVLVLGRGKSGRGRRVSVQLSRCCTSILVARARSQDR